MWRAGEWKLLLLLLLLHNCSCLEMTPYTLIHDAVENSWVRKCKTRTAILSLANVWPLPTAPHVVETTTWNYTVAPSQLSFCYHYESKCKYLICDSRGRDPQVENHCSRTKLKELLMLFKRQMSSWRWLPLSHLKKNESYLNFSLEMLSVAES